MPTGFSQPDFGRMRESLSRRVPTGHPSRRGAGRSVVAVDNRAEVREFLISRRAKITPEQAGLPAVGARRVPGLRRGEVAALAGVSVEYYAKLERGAIGGVSASVLDAHRPRPAARRRRTSPPVPPRPRRRRHQRRHAARRRPSKTLDAPAQPAVGARRASPPRRSSATAGWTCSPPTTSAGPCTPPSTTTNPAARPTSPASPSWTRRRPRFYPDWDLAADTCVAILRTEAGRDPHDKALHDLVGELSTRSEDFRRRWGTPRRPPPRRRNQTLPPHRRRRPRPRLRERRHDLRPRPHPHHLRRRTRPRPPPTPSTCSPPGPARAQSPTRGRRARAGVGTHASAWSRQTSSRPGGRGVLTVRPFAGRSSVSARSLAWMS